MVEIRKRVDAFLRKYGMHYDSVVIEQGCRDFVDEMERGLRGEESSLKMICTYISPEGGIPVDEPVAVMDAGGTNFRVALVRFNDNKQVIENFRSFSMPGSTSEITREDFFDTITDYLMPIIDKSRKIGWSFSFPTEILPNRDGRLLYFDKEIRVKGMNGDVIGASLLKTLEKKGVTSRKTIVVVNDSVATLLAGKAACPDREFGSYIGFILGTGTNTCYIEENKNIIKHPDICAKPGFTIVNTESGGFCKAPRGSADIEFDHSTADPGAQLLEKMISGAYQGGLLFAIIRMAIGDGLFSEAFSEYFKRVTSLTSRDVNDFCLYPYSGDNILARGMRRNDNDDRTTMYCLIDAFVERAAKLSALNLAAVIIKSGKGTNPCLPVCVAAEGTTFYKSALFRKKLDFYIKQSLNDQMGIFCEFVRVDNATLSGTAIAGLLNDEL